MAWNEPGNKGNQHDPWGGGRKPEPNKGSNQGPADLD